jgi:hypothetical protein
MWQVASHVFFLKSIVHANTNLKCTCNYYAIVIWPDGRTVGWPNGRMAGRPGGRMAGWPGGRCCMARQDPSTGANASFALDAGDRAPTGSPPTRGSGGSRRVDIVTAGNAPGRCDARCDAVWCTVRRGATRRGAVWCTVRRGAVRRGTMHSTARCGAARCSVVHGTARRGAVRRGAARRGAFCCIGQCMALQRFALR